MIHAGTVAASPEELAAWIARTDDLRATLTNGGYGSAFTADDLFPLFEGYVAKATAAAPRPRPGRARWPRLAVIVAVIAIVVAVLVVWSG